MRDVSLSKCTSPGHQSELNTHWLPLASKSPPGRLRKARRTEELGSEWGRGAGSDLLCVLLRGPGSPQPPDSAGLSHGEKQPQGQPSDAPGPRQQESAGLAGAGDVAVLNHTVWWKSQKKLSWTLYLLSWATKHRKYIKRITQTYNMSSPQMHRRIR